MYHGRNMDIGLIVENITAQVQWMREGEKVLETTQFLGSVQTETPQSFGPTTTD
eukprot:SAG11_NODE_2707_length_3064_cov_1.595278_4_plen_54_part_00